MRKLILVRAGASAWDEQKRLQGIVSLPLCDAGKEALRPVAQEIEALSPDVLFSSGNESAGPTAEWLGTLCGLKPRKLVGLHEMDCGMWQGLREEEIRRRFGTAYREWRHDPGLLAPPQGESLAEVWERVRAGLAELRRKNRGKVVVLVAARIVSALIECAVRGVEPRLFWQVLEQMPVMLVHDFQPAPAAAERV